MMNGKKFCGICPECAGRNVHSRLRLYQITWDECVKMCENETCLYPITTNNVEDVVVKTKMLVKNDQKLAVRSDEQQLPSTEKNEIPESDWTRDVFDNRNEDVAHLASMLDRLASEAITCPDWTGRSPIDDDDDLKSLISASPVKVATVSECGSKTCPQVPKTCPQVPKTCPQVPKTCPQVPRTCPQVPSGGGGDIHRVEDSAVNELSRTVENRRKLRCPKRSLEEVRPSISRVNSAKCLPANNNVETTSSMSGYVSKGFSSVTRETRRTPAATSRSSRKPSVSSRTPTKCGIVAEDSSRAEPQPETVEERPGNAGVSKPINRLLQRLLDAKLKVATTGPKQPSRVATAASKDKTGTGSKKRPAGGGGGAAAAAKARPAKKPVPASAVAINCKINMVSKWLRAVEEPSTGETRFAGYQSTSSRDDDLVSEDSGIQSPNSFVSAESDSCLSSAVPCLDNRIS